MKTFHFRQDNSFHDSLQLNITAECKEQAIKFIEAWIIANTSSEQMAFDEGKDYIYEAFLEKRKETNEYIYSLEQEKQAEAYNHYFNEEILCTNDKCYTLQEMQDDSNIFNIFGEEAAKRTYIWAFKNEEYTLEEIDMIVPGVNKATYIYQGR